MAMDERAASYVSFESIRSIDQYWLAETTDLL
jgi:hypothetical protein